MHDDQLFQDIKLTTMWQVETLETFRQHGITTYSRLFALLRDKNADMRLREAGCWTLSWAGKKVDKRRAVPPLLAVLQSGDTKAQDAAALALGWLRSRRAMKPIVEIILADKERRMDVRESLITTICSIDDSRIPELLKPLIFDQTDNVWVRSRAIEQLTILDGRWLSNWIALLSDPSSDIRFAAAGSLASERNLPSVLAELDRIVAFDHTVPTYWGWHVDREAIPALEKAYLQMEAEYEASRLWISRSWLVSPAPEYDGFVQQYRTPLESWVYETRPTPPVTLSLDPDWLADQLRRRWPDVELNARQPRPQAYLLDWRLRVDGQLLSGALHRDRYAVVLTSANSEAVRTFARWYRGIIPPEQPLFLYERAGEGEALLPSSE
jgi:hypothetical protein